jgi:hypothetical protein
VPPHSREARVNNTRYNDAMAGVRLPALDVAARDALYVAVGFGVIGIQRMAVLRRELIRDAEQRLGTPLTLPAVAARISSPRASERR